jgi:hypothetical protein
MSRESFIQHAAGHYRVLPSGAAYCAAVVPDEGYEVVRVQLQPWLPLERAWAFFEAHLKREQLPVQAFCGIELRVPEPLTFDRWSAFNVPYLEQIGRWGLRHGELSGVCRSNIALALHPPKVTSASAFSYVAPADGANGANGRSFLLSGQADIDRGKIIAAGDTGPAAMRQRTRFTLDTVAATLGQIGASWRDTTQLALFHAHDIPELWDAELLGRVGEAVARGVLVYRARPPIAGGEVELEARAVRREVVLATG